MEKIPVVVVGPHGKKLGRPVCEALVAADDDFEPYGIVRGRNDVNRDIWGVPLFANFRDLTASAWGEDAKRGVVFYAVKADALDARLYEATANGYRRLVIGTTGLSAVQKDKIYHLADHNTIVYASNFSVEAVLLGVLSSIAAQVLNTHEVEIDETHHHDKKDQPSGTAKSVAEAIANARGQKPADVIQYGWPESINTRPREIINITSHRGGKVPGEHTVAFHGEHGTFSLVQQALSSGGFAAGALRAIRWCAENEQTGRVFDMEDVLGIRE